VTNKRNNVGVVQCGERFDVSEGELQIGRRGGGGMPDENQTAGPAMLEDV
jgi:hypothetical protein